MLSLHSPSVKSCTPCREELTQPVFTAMDAFEYPELHDESIPANNFFTQLSKLMVASGVKDFSWRVCACAAADVPDNISCRSC